MMNYKRVGALAVLLWCGINQTPTYATAFIELMLDCITKMEVESSTDLASKGSKGRKKNYSDTKYALTGVGGRK